MGRGGTRQRAACAEGPIKTERGTRVAPRAQKEKDRSIGTIRWVGRQFGVRGSTRDGTMTMVMA